MKFNSLLGYIGCLALLFSGLLAAQPVSLPDEEVAPVRALREFTRKSDPGLPQSSSIALLIDRRGVLWIGSLGGLASFDGHSIQPIDDPEGPIFDGIYSLAEHPRGGIFAGSSADIFGLVNERWQRIPAPGGSWELAFSPDGELWRIDGKRRVWRQQASPTAEWQEAELPDGFGQAVDLGFDANRQWLADRERVFVRAENAQWRSLATVAAPGQISAVTSASDGRWWIGTRDGAIHFARGGADGWQSVPMTGWTGGRIRVLAEDRRGRIWGGGNDGGVAYGHADGQPWRFWGTDNGLYSDGILEILADPHGGLWWSLNGHGLQQWVGEGWSHRNHWRGVEEKRVKVFGVRGTDDGRFLAAVFDLGLWYWDGQTMHQYDHRHGLDEDLRFAIEPEPGVIWAAGRFGAWESRQEGRFERTLVLDHGMANSFHRDPQGTWYLASTANGLFRHEQGQWQPAEDLNAQLPEGNIRDVLWRANGEMWLAVFDHGVVRFADGKRLPFTAAESAAIPQRANALLDLGDQVWIGGLGGLGIWQPGNSRLLTLADGLPGHTVYDLIHSPDGVVWACGSAGIARFAKDQWQIFSSSNGLIEDECNHQGLWLSPSGELWAGTMSSLARFDTRLQATSTAELALQWTQRPLASGDGVAEVLPDQRMVELGWTASWLTPRAIEYRMRGVRWSGWSPPRRERSFTFEDIGPGEKRVAVAARFVGEEEWSEPIETRFYVVPRWWETIGFRLLLLAGLLAALWLAVRWRTRVLSGRASELERRVEESVAHLKILSGLLPICSGCKSVRDDDGYWQQIESYIDAHSEAHFTHGLCPNCAQETLEELARHNQQAASELVRR